MNARPSNRQPDCDDSDSSRDDEATEDENAPQEIEEEEEEEVNKRLGSERRSLRVIVQRGDIESTTVKEGNEELDELDVDVYDQTAYEQGIFEQVDRAITETDPLRTSAASTSNGQTESGTSSSINDLIRLIHDQDTSEPHSVGPTERDEQLLELTRAQRLNKRVKLESTEAQKEPRVTLPKIPRLFRPNSNDQDESCSKQTEVPPDVEVLWTPKFGTETSVDSTKRQNTKEVNTEDSNEDSSASEYQPSREEESEDADDDDLEYSSDEDQNQVDDVDSVDEDRRKHKGIKDDGDHKYYSTRMKIYARERAKLRLGNIAADGVETRPLDRYHIVEGDLQLPEEMWDGLFEHQRTGVRWLWELHQLGTGGILGDEMGLGKTIQMIAFLTALKCSNIVSVHKSYRGLGPTVLVCPATVMHQWLLEFRKWYPPFRVAILHSTGTFSGEKKQLVQIIYKCAGVLICSYPGVIIYQDILHGFDWHYAILDEGHKIRNPDAQVTLACKRFRTPHRIILSGSPVQNNLKELWSIFDFIYPGKLGTLPVFMGQFAIPITQGGYANSTDVQVQIAYKCACVLRDTIKPFLLRRTKAEVNSKLKLPDRNEQVLFCKLTDRQRKMYQSYLDSPTVRDIKLGLCQIFVGLIQLRKICNHPDLFDSSDCRHQQMQAQKANEIRHKEFFSEDETFGHFRKSGKMMVVEALLKLWKKQSHKVLLFTQSRQMLKIFSMYLRENNYTFLIMDGTTPINTRQTMIDQFNKDEGIFLFLLTTRVGGVGVNLIGANRIIIYDPDWNPSTDIQARERAWRIGQQRHVIIYRLLTAGTIEEKIYHRQVFKLYLTNRILKDAKQKRFFKTNDLHELFTLGDNEKNIETNALFDEDLSTNPDKARKNKKAEKKRKKREKKMAAHMLSTDQQQIQLSEAKRAEIRERAKKLSQMIASRYGTRDTSTTGADVIIKKEHENTSHDLNSVASKIRTKAVQDCSRDISASSRPTTSKSEQSNELAHSVDYIVKQDTYKPTLSVESRESSQKEDDYILRRLFKSSNVFGALKHDKIESDSGSDFKVVESEAERVARDAIRALKESRRLCQDSRSGIPNWTGSNGSLASRPRLVPKNKSNLNLINSQRSSSSKPSGGSLLESIRQRNQSNPIALARSTFGVGEESEEEESNFEGTARKTGADEMADRIRKFVMFESARNGEAATDEMLDFFKRNYPPDKTAIFKAILYKICEFQRRGTQGFWTVRSEFKN